MYEGKNEEQKEKYRKLSLFIDNIERYNLTIEKNSEFTFKQWVIIIVRNGILEMKLGARKFNLKTNDALVIRKGKKITFSGQAGEECWCTMIFFDGSGVTAMMKYLEMGDITRFNVAGSIKAADLDAMWQSWESGSYFRASILLQELLLNIRDTVRRDYGDANMNAVYQYIQEHFSEPLDLSNLARIYGTSISYFSRVFKERFSMTPMNFVNKIRIHYARIYLSTTNMKVQEVGQYCGFERLEYFCYVFKKSEGCTPSQYRENRRHIGLQEETETAEKTD